MVAAKQLQAQDFKAHSLQCEAWWQGTVLDLYDQLEHYKGQSDGLQETN